MKEKQIKISNKKIGKNNPVFIVAELSANHMNDFELAEKTIYAAKDVGADAVKVQTYTPDTLTCDCSNEYFKINLGALWDGQTLYELYKQAYMPWEWQADLKKIAESLGLIFFSSPFDVSAVDFLETIDNPVYKIASFEINDIPLIEYIAKKGKPIIMSTGIAKYDEINNAVSACRNCGNNDIILLWCVSSYPAKPEEMNLKVIPDMADKFNVIAGLSDHTLNSATPEIAVALGAKVIEKHIILDRSLGGVDADFSLEPEEFKQMVSKIRETETLLGTVTYDLSEQAEKNRKFMRSLFCVKDIKKGQVFTAENIKSIRPADGLSPCEYKNVIGKKAKQDLVKGTPFKKGYYE